MLKNPNEFFPEIEVCDNRALLQLVYDKFEISMTEEELMMDIPTDYVSKVMKTPIIDFQKEISRWQTEYSQENERILESLKRIDGRPKLKHANDDDIELSTSDINNKFLGLPNYSTPNLINVEGVKKKQRDVMKKQLPNMGIQGTLSTTSAFSGRGIKRGMQDEIGKLSRKRSKFAPLDVGGQNQSSTKSSTVTASHQLPKPNGSLKSEQSEFLDIPYMPNIVITVVKSLASSSVTIPPGNKKTPSTMLVQLPPSPTIELTKGLGRNTKINQVRKDMKTQRAAVTEMDSKGQTVNQHQVKTTVESSVELNKICTSVAEPSPKSDSKITQSGPTNDFVFKIPATPLRGQRRFAQNEFKTKVQSMDEANKRQRVAGGGQTEIPNSTNAQIATLYKYLKCNTLDRSEYNRDKIIIS